MTRRAVPFGAGFYSGLFAAFCLCVNGVLGSRGFVLLITAATFIGLLAMLFRVSFRARILLFCGAFSIAVAYSAVYTSLRLRPLEALDGQQVKLSGKVIDCTESDRSTVTVKGSVNGIPAKVVIYADGFPGELGDKVSLTVKVSKIEDTPFFRSREYYFTDGIYLMANISGEINLNQSDKNLVDMIRAYSKSVSLGIRRTVDGETGEFLAEMVTGDRTVFSDGLRLKLNRSGIGHLAAVSGLHVTVITFAITLLLKKLRVPRTLCALFSEAFIIVFIIFSGLRISAIRAGIMATVSLCALLARRRSDALNTICLCAVAMTLSNPYAAADSALCLSLAGVFGVSVAAPAMIREFRIRGRIPRTLAATVCASAATAPFVMLWFNELSLVAPLSNLVAVPVCSFALILGMIYAVSGCTLTFIAALAGQLCSAVVKLSEILSSLRFTYIPLGSTLIKVITAVFTVFVIVLAVTKRTRKAFLCAAVCICVVICAYSTQSIVLRKDVFLDVLDRGSSQSLVLRKGGECIIIDYSGKMSSETSELLSKNGISRILAVILYDRAEAAYSAYSSLPIDTDVIYLAEGGYIFNGGSEWANFPDGSSVEVFDLRVTPSADGALIEYRDGAVTVSCLKGVTVVNDGRDAEILRSDCIKELRIGG